jgi:quercetin dioxygenase-like cupin family protein
MSSVLITRPGTNAHLDVFGPTIEFLALPEKADGSYCVMLATLPPGVAVPLHSHPESFFLISGAVQVLSERGGKLEWRDVECSEFVHVASNAKHAWRNNSRSDESSFITGNDLPVDGGTVSR